MNQAMNTAIFKFAYEMAFRDATMRKAFPKRAGESDKDFKNRKQSAKDVAIGTVETYIKGIFATAKSDPIDVIKDVSEVGRNFGFTFGNSLRWEWQLRSGFRYLHNLTQNVALPDFLGYWPRLKRPEDIDLYIQTKPDILMESVQFSKSFRFDEQTMFSRQNSIDEFYRELKRKL